MKSRERIYIIFHWAGVAFGLVILLIFLSGYLFPAVGGLIQTLGITLLVVGVVILIQSNDNLRGVEILSCRSAPVPAGEDAICELTLRNHSDRERLGLTVRTGWRIRPRLSVRVPVIEAHTTLTVSLRLPTKQRGRFPYPPLWVSSVMPAGLCFAWKPFSNSGFYVVYPAPVGRPLELIRSTGNAIGAATHQGNEDVSGHRPYEPGDALSRMDWRVFARSGRLAVRTLEESGGGEITLRWRNTHFLTTDEARLAQLSFWIAQCRYEGRPFQLELGAEPRDLSHRNLPACLEALATFGTPE